MSATIPVVLFAYSRPEHLRRTLDCLRENQTPLIYAFSDGPRAPVKAPAVAQVRDMLRSIDWCELVFCERETNLGLGRSILAGVTEVLSKHEAAIVFEDDVVCVAGTYDYLCAALKHYKDDARVMSVTGWTHPLVTPSDAADQPYFDGRAESWVWGTWARAWQGLDQDAQSLMLACEARGIDRNKYGSDLPAMAEIELQRNLWAVRWLYYLMLNEGLCLRPPWSMVEHIGFDAQATNAQTSGKLANPPLKPCPPLPTQWPKPIENRQCSALWQEFYAAKTPATMTTRSTSPGLLAYLKRGLKQVVSGAVDDPAVLDMSQREFAKLFLPPVAIGLFRRVRSWGQSVKIARQNGR